MFSDENEAMMVHIYNRKSWNVSPIKAPTNWPHWVLCNCWCFVLSLPLTLSLIHLYSFFSSLAWFSPPHFITILMLSTDGSFSIWLVNASLIPITNIFQFHAMLLLCLDPHSLSLVLRLRRWFFLRSEWVVNTFPVISNCPLHRINVISSACFLFRIGQTQ